MGYCKDLSQQQKRDLSWVLEFSLVRIETGKKTPYVPWRRNNRDIGIPGVGKKFREVCRCGLRTKKRCFAHHLQPERSGEGYMGIKGLEGKSGGVRGGGERKGRRV